MSNQKQARREAAIKKAKRKKKTIITVCLALVVALALLVVFTIAANNRVSEEALDLTQMGTNFAIAELNRIARNPEAYLGRTIKMSGFYYFMYEPLLGRFMHAVAVAPVDPCCPFQGLKLVFDDDIDDSFYLPEDKTAIEVTGTFGMYEENGREFHYLKVDEFFIFDGRPIAIPHTADNDIDSSISDYVLDADTQEPAITESPEPTFPEPEPRERMFDFKSEINDGVLDLTGLAYPGLLEFTEGNLNDFLGITIKVRGLYTVIHDHTEDGFCVHLVFLTDAKGCCPAMLAFRLVNEYDYICPDDYPRVEEEITVAGTLVQAPTGRWYRFYIQVDEIVRMN